MKKRYRRDSSGEEMGRRMLSENSARKMVRRMLNPFPEGLLAEYFHYSTPLERIVFVVFLPLKLLMAYRGQILTLVCYSR